MCCGGARTGLGHSATLRETNGTRKDVPRAFGLLISAVRR